MEPIINIEHLTKSYNRIIYYDLSIKIQPKQVVCILAPNGVGKTTLLKMIAGLVTQDEGQILVNGIEVGNYSKQLVSYMEEHPDYPKWMKVRDLANFYHECYKDFNIERFYEYLEKSPLNIDMKVSNMSKGMKEQLQFGLIIARDSLLYLLDEPFGGVDLMARERLFNYVRDLKEREKSIIITTHYPEIMVDLFDTVIIMTNKGVKAVITADELKERKLIDIYKEIMTNEIL